MSLYIVCEGDSLTVGLNLAATSRSTYPFQLALLYTDNRMVSITNAGVSAETLADMVLEPEVTAAYNAAKGRQILVLWGGTNDIYFGATAATAFTRLQACCTQWVGVGYRIVIPTALSRSNAGTPGTFNTTRATFNGLIRSSTPAGCVVADVAANSLIGPDGAELDTTYFDADKVHMNATGYGVVASIVKTAVDAALLLP